MKVKTLTIQDVRGNVFSYENAVINNVKDNMVFSFMHNETEHCFYKRNIVRISFTV